MIPPVWTDLVGLGVVSSGVERDVGLSVLGVVLVPVHVLVDVSRIESSVGDEAADEDLGEVSVGL